MALFRKVPARARSWWVDACLGFAALALPLAAQAGLTVTPLTWNIVGLDSNNPATGPRHFPVGARICAVGTASNGAVTAHLVWDSANANIGIRPGSNAILNFPALAANSCVDAYFEIAVNPVPAAFDTTRRYRVTAVDGNGTVSSPAPRELYVEHLVSQSRNAITNVRYGTNPANLVSVPPGGNMSLVVGNTYTIELSGGTATQGYEQFEAFINFTNTIFQILNVSTTYSADTTTHVGSPNDKLYGDACLWDNNPNSPTYRNCLDVGKIGGSSVVSTYTIKIVGGGGTSQTLNTLLYDFSGSSYHYNADYGLGGRVADLIDPETATIDKSFTPSTVPVGGVSTLKITLNNPNSGTLAGYNFVDNLPANMVVATPATFSTSGCGTPTFAPTAGATTLNFSNGTVAGNSACTISVGVTTSTTGAFMNTTNHLFVGTTDTGDDATAVLTVNNAPPPPACTPGIELARFEFNPAQGTTVPPLFTSKSSRVASATALYSANGVAGATDTISTVQGGGAVNSWNGSHWNELATGFPSATTGPYFEFTLDTSNFSNVQMSFRRFLAPNGSWGPNAGNFVYTYSSADGGAFSSLSSTQTNKNIWQPALVVAAAATGTANTRFRLNAVGSNGGNTGALVYLDDVIFTGCGIPDHPTLTKAFSPNPIAAGATSTLTFTLTNPNNIALTGATFADALPAGMTVSANGFVTNTCGFSATAPTVGATSLAFSGGSIPANGACTVAVNVTSSVPGPSTNISGFISTTQTGENSGPGGSAVATLTVIAPPSIDKVFNPNPIIPGGVTTLTFNITNPNVNNTISGVAFSDTFPVVPGAMVVAAVTNAGTTGCGAPTFAPVAGAGSVSFSGGTIAAGATCSVRVNVTAPTAGSYVNTSSNVSHIVNGVPVNGNTASDTLTVNPPNPAIALLKQVGPSAAGPWSDFLGVEIPGNVFYRFVVENIGDVPLSPVTLTDPPGGPAVVCTPALPASLPVADANDDDHLATCVIGPIAANASPTTTVNTARATGSFGGTPVSDDDSATYGVASLSMVKLALPTAYTAAGQVINYTFTVTNNGGAPLAGPFTINDDRTTDEACPDVSTVGDLDGFLDPGETLVCTASYTILASDVSSGSVVNIAFASNGTVDSPTDTETVTRARPDLAITKSDGGATATPGGTVSYLLTYRNNGTANATGVVLTETVPANTTFNAGASTAGWSCVPNNNAGSTCTLAIGGLATGVSGNATFAVTVANPLPAGIAQIANTATVSDDGVSGADPTPADNSASDTTPVNAAPDLSILKSDGGASVAPGGTVSYTLTYSNIGNQGATGVVVTEVVPANTTFNPGASTAGWSCTPNNNAGSTCTLAIGALSASAGGSATFAVTVANPLPAGVTQISNTATIADDGSNGTDPTPSNNSGSDTTPVTAAPDLNIVKSDGGASVAPGGTVSYTLTYSNAGNQGATGVALTETVPANTTFNAGASTAGWSCTPNNNAGSTCTLAIGALSASAGGSATFAVTVANPLPAGVTQISNTATVADDGSNGPDATPGDNSSSDTTPVTAAPDLRVSKDDGGTSAGAGATVSYVLSYANAGNQGATGVVLTETVPANTTFNPGASTGGWACVPNGNAGSTCTLAIGALAAGANGTATFAVTVDTPLPGGVTQVSNTVTIADDGANGPDPTPGDNTDTDTTPLNAPALSIVKTAPASATVGVAFDYTLTVTNNGSAATTAPATVTDVIPAGLTINSAAGCTIAAQTVTCTVAAGLSNTAPGNTAVFTINVTPTAGTASPIVNTASVTGGGDPACTTNNDCTDGESTPLNSPALSIQKSAPVSATVGVPFDYTLTVTNTGTTATTATATVVDVIPSGLTINSATGCTIASQAVTCTISAGLAGAGGTASFTINVTPTGSAANPIINNASVTGGGDPNCTTSTSCTDSTSTPLNSPALSIMKSAPASATVGVAFDYMLTVTNSGTAATTAAATVTDVIPSGLTINSAAGCTIAAQTVTCTIPSGLAAGGGTASFTINVTPTGAATNPIVNNASVTGGGDPACLTTNDCTDGESTPLNSPALSIAKSAPGAATVGVAFDYTLTVTNAGTTATTAAATVTDVIPAGLTINSAPGCAIAAQTVTCTIAAGLSHLAPNNTAAFTINVTPTAGAANPIVNNASVTGGGDPNCTTSTSCTDGTSTPLDSPALTIVKTAPSSATIGVAFDYTLTVTNNGTAATTTAATVTDVIPAGLTINSATGCTMAAQTVTCTIPSGLAANGGSASFTINVTPTANALSPIANNASVTGGGDPTCTTSSSCTDGTSTPLNGVPDLILSKTHTGNFVRGQAGGAYSLMVTNIGTGASSGTVTVVDTLPAGLTATSIGGTGWSCVLGTLTCTRGDALAAGASFPAISIAVSVNADAPDSLINVAVVSGGSDSDPDNNTDDDPVTVTNGAPDQPPVPVPVDARWALLLMGLSFLALAARQRQRLH